MTNPAKIRRKYLAHLDLYCSGRGWFRFRLPCQCCYSKAYREVTPAQSDKAKADQEPQNWPCEKNQKVKGLKKHD